MQKIDLNKFKVGSKFKMRDFEDGHVFTVTRVKPHGAGWWIDTLCHKDGTYKDRGWTYHTNGINLSKDILDIVWSDACNVEFSSRKESKLTAFLKVSQ